MVKKVAINAENIKCVGEVTRSSDSLLDIITEIGDNTLYVVVGIGYCGHDMRIFSALNDTLSTHNSHLCVVRGEGESRNAFCSDSTRYVNEKYSNVHVIEDYSIICTPEKNILVIGGSVSANRQWRKKHVELLKKHNPDIGINDVYDGGGMATDEEAIKLLLDGNEKIDIVITSAAPLFVWPSFDMNGVKWSAIDKTLKIDSLRERSFCDYIFHQMVKTDKLPSVWAYTKYPSYQAQKILNTIFTSIPNDEVFCISSPDKKDPVGSSEFFTSHIGRKIEALRGDRGPRSVLLTAEDLTTHFEQIFNDIDEQMENR